MSESQGKSSLTPTQMRVLEALIHQPTIALAAAAAKITDRTIYRWLRNDENFKAEYLHLRWELVNNTVLQLQKAANNAANCLQSVMDDPESPASARVAAAKTVLEMSFKALEVEDQERRIAELERLYAQQNLPTNGHRVRRGPYSY
jgi:hypothetical protein